MSIMIYRPPVTNCHTFSNPSCPLGHDAHYGQPLMMQIISIVLLFTDIIVLPSDLLI